MTASFHVFDVRQKMNINKKNNNNKIIILSIQINIHIMSARNSFWVLFYPLLIKKMSYFFQKTFCLYIESALMWTRSVHQRWKFPRFAPEASLPFLQSVISRKTELSSTANKLNEINRKRVLLYMLSWMPCVHANWTV